MPGRFCVNGNVSFSVPFSHLRVCTLHLMDVSVDSEYKRLISVTCLCKTALNAH